MLQKFFARMPRTALLVLAAAIALPQAALAQANLNLARANLNPAQAALTIAEAQRIAIERSRLLSAQDAAISAIRETAVSVGQLPDPTLKLGLDTLPVTSVPGVQAYSLTQDSFTTRRIGIMQEITRDEKRRLRTERGERDVVRAEAEKRVAIANIHRDTALAWLDRFFLERMREVVATQAQEANLEIEAAEGAYRAGRGGQSDIHAARASRIAIDDRLSDYERRILNARAALARWIGDAANQALAGEPFTDTVPIAGNNLETDLRRHPMIALLNRQFEIAETDVQLARANRQSDWTVEIAYGQRGPAYSNLFSVGVSIPLQWDQKNRQNREVAAKIAVAEQVKALEEDALRAHIAEVRAMLNDWENGRERLARYERELLPLARDRTGASLAAYRGGKGDLSSVLSARRNEIELRLQALQIQMDTTRAWAQLNSLDPADNTHAGPATKESK